MFQPFSTDVVGAGLKGSSSSYIFCVVYSSGNVNVVLPSPNTIGSIPALGTTFHDKVKVTFLLPLYKKENKLRRIEWHSQDWTNCQNLHQKCGLFFKKNTKSFPQKTHIFQIQMQLVQIRFPNSKFFHVYQKVPVVWTCNILISKQVQPN